MTESSESPTASPDVIELTAPLLFGPVFNWALYGILCVQIYVYSYNFPNDRRSIKFLAYFVFLLETVQTALTGADIYYWFVAGFGDVERLGNSHFTPIDIPVIAAVISLIVQGYFCYRIWTLNDRSSWICWIIAVAAVTQSVAATWASSKSLMVGGKYMVTKAALYLWSISGALADILIAVAMTLLLRKASGNLSSFVLIRVVRLTIETNALTAALAITSLVLYVAFPDKLYYAYTTEIIGKVYSNTLLVSLNNRIYFREHKPPGHGDSACLTVSDPVHATELSPLCFAVPEPQPRTPPGDNFRLCTLAQTVELDMGEGDDTSIPWSPSRSRRCHLLPDDPESTDETLPLTHGR
ncbi:hypothetical protein EDB84DRAFT_1414771 [Lactarius hengduanensis]|nr:hypothetical protein EDB84DRAFT_1414771 [Lactarius hengduanensis]